MSSKRKAPAEKKEPEKRADKPEQVPPSSGRTFETAREGVHSATEGGVPDPTVQPGGGTVSDPMPGR